MANRYWFAAAAAAALGFNGFAAAPPFGSGVTTPCDRSCMSGIVDRYLAALVRHDPTGLPLNRDVKFTENGARLKVGGEGTVGGRIRVADWIPFLCRRCRRRPGWFLRRDEGAAIGR